MNENRKYQECVRCVMDTTDPDIEFDDAGLCNHCREYNAYLTLTADTNQTSSQKLKSLAEQIKQDGAGKRYDCVTGVSGGVDSTYVVYLLKQLGLRPLVVHLDNGWNSELAVKNIEQIITKLGFDLFTRVLDWEEFRELQLAYLEASVLDLEALTDHAISATLFDQAAKNGVKYIIAGTNRATEAILPINWRYANKTNDAVNIRHINKTFRKKAIKDFPLMSFQRYCYYWKVKKIEWVSILDDADYNKDEAKATIQRELGWKDYGGKHYESIITRFYQGYILPRKFGIDKRRAHLSTLIASNQITREAALEALQAPLISEDILAQDLIFVPKKLGISPEAFEAIMQLPAKSHYDYRTDKKLREMIFSINRKLFK
ncbi:MAG: hypothetical protein RLY16_2385 [Bacteroidota bacterium]|jgi:N-acetyl sugar amidotransferase